MTHQAKYGIDSRHTTREDVYNLRDLISRQWNWKLTEHLIYRICRALKFETENKWDVVSSRLKELVKKNWNITYVTV